MSYLINDAAQGMGLKKTMVAGEAIESHKLVYVASNGKCYLVNADAVSTMPAMGISCGPISEDGTGEILLLGLISSTNWSWVTGSVDSVLYASTQIGDPTQTKPLQTGNQVQIVGTAVTETLILFSPNYALEEI